MGVQTLIAFLVAKSLKTRATHIAKPQLKTFQLLHIKKCFSGHRFPAGTSGTPALRHQRRFVVAPRPLVLWDVLQFCFQYQNFKNIWS